ncbi:hypothetical protein ACJJIU_00215 [Microbulbifer sp. CnH-101-E]|uniref:hypothetical protein n=1 Tax=unclassified Microbulbifer TaxID=2619833 RepID=UPI004039C0B0
MKKVLSTVLAAVLPVSAAMATTYQQVEIEKIQGEGIDDVYNSVHIKTDVNNSPCQSTNSTDRFAIVNNVQQSIVIAALMAGKKITIDTTGVCNDANIEIVNYIMLYADS